MFNWLFRGAKKQYFFEMLKKCLENTDLNLGNYSLDEAAHIFFPEREVDLNVKEAISKKLPLNTAAMHYYANCVKIRCVDEVTGEVDMPRYGNMIQGMVIYLVSCKHDEILDYIHKVSIINEFKDDFELIIQEQRSIQW